MKTYSAWAAVFVATLAATPGATAPQLPADSAAGDSLRKRPAYVNNAEQPYFPPVFNQAGGSCGSASRIGYMFTYEINALRGDTAQRPEHIYPTHFTWLLTNSNSGKEGMAMANGVPNAAVYGGTTYSALFGNQDCSADDFGWMQGYDKWFAAMQNRISHNSFSPYGLDTEEGRELVKNWLWNHCGDSTFHAGGICGIGVASACKQGSMADDPAGENRAAGLVGKKYVTRWGDGVDHALTIVGYDDRAVFDLDGNGLYGEPGKDERGAWIIVNSWGNRWANEGFIYCPYKYSFPVRQNEGGAWKPEFYHARKNYRPLRTLKVRMDYSRRSELRLSVGIAADTTATEPEATVAMEHFKFAGDGRGAGRKWGLEAATPMLGRWADRRLHDEPMEFGYDLTDLSARFDTRRPLKYFFIIETRDYAIGTGQLYDCSVIDYEQDRRGVETRMCFEPGTFVDNGGRRTVVSAVVQGEPLFAPRNLRAEGATLLWDAPQTTHYALDSYVVWRDGAAADTLPATQLRYAAADTTATYALTALYAAGDTLLASARTQEVEAPEEAGGAGSAQTDAPMALRLRKSGFVIPDVFSSNHDEATLEFWLKPRKLKNWNQSIGHGWGSFLIHANADSTLSAGWDAGSRLDTPQPFFTPGRWQHLAFVVSHDSLTVCLNGRPVQGLRAKGFAGMGGFGNFSFGTSQDGAIDGDVAEVRVWKTARTPDEIRSTMHMCYAGAGMPPTLLAYYRGDSIRKNGRIMLRDHAGGHHAAFATYGSHKPAGDAPAMQPYAGESHIEIVVPRDTVTAGAALRPEARCTPDVLALSWTAPGAGAEKLAVSRPELCFAKTGRQTIRLEARTADGRTLTTERTVVVEKPATDAAFAPVRLRGAAGERITFAPLHPLPGWRYEWSLPGGEETSARTMLAATTYPTAGTYEVSLRVTPPDGGRSRRTTQTFTVENVAPVADFALTPMTLLRGETATLTDRSRYAPLGWTWSVSRPGDTLRLEGAKPTLRPLHPGVYDVTLTATNEKGSGTKTVKRALTVCNADSKNGLSLNTATAAIATERAPYAGEATGLTVEWWMHPAADGSELRIGDGAETWAIAATGGGSLSLTADSTTVSSPGGFVTAGEWHHYAAVFDDGKVTFYRDGMPGGVQKLRKGKKRVGSLPAIDRLRIWGDGGAAGTVIDEVRLWKKALTTEQLRTYANAPVAEVARAEREDSLTLYYDCNQGSGDLTDATSHRLTGRRTGFGPDGDAWGLSRGVFSLDFEGQTEDVTERYLPPSTRPFATDSTSVNKNNRQRFLALATESGGKTWHMENAVESDSIRTGFHVDVAKGRALCVFTEWDGFAKTLDNHKIYCTATLPAGTYELEVVPYSDFTADASRLAVAKGTKLDGGADGEGWLANVPLSCRRTRFTVEESGNVSMGIVANLEGRGGLALECIVLRRLVGQNGNGQDGQGL